MTDDNAYPGSFVPMNAAPKSDKAGETPPVLKDYFCPFCGHKLFRGDVNEFNMVCQECNKLVNSKEMSTSPQDTE